MASDFGLAFYTLPTVGDSFLMILWLVKRIQGVKSTTCDFMLTLIPTQSVRMMRCLRLSSHLTSQLRGLKPGLLGGKHTFVITFCFSSMYSNFKLPLCVAFKKLSEAEDRTCQLTIFANQRNVPCNWLDGVYTVVLL